MKKMIMFLIVAMVIMLNAVIPCTALDERGFTVGPTQLNVTVPENSSNTTYVYITSYVDGELILGTENLPFSIEPTTIPITSTDRTRKVEIKVNGNTSLTTGQYSGKLTLLLYTGSNVAHGVKINANITQTVPEIKQSWLDEITEIIMQNIVIIIAVVAIIVALTTGVFIGRKSKKMHDVSLTKRTNGFS
jgi:hypothetical protein